MKWLILVSAVLLAGSLLGARWWFGQTGQERGAAIYRGKTELKARLPGQTDDLPGVATRCANCHEPASASVKAYAPRLDRAWLTAPRVRHGGPVSAYSPRSLCALLRKGVDPVSVVIPTSMPRYEVSDGQCEDLWAFLLTR